ncbi:MAG: hypothetical protein J0L86_14800 [Flavobacteriales bacterium]|nr:hypothetical protein [Flavobacteriales bacterium]
MKEDTAKVNMINRITFRRDPFYFEHDTRKKLILQSLAIARKIKYKKGEGYAHVCLGQYYAALYDKDKALAQYNKSLAIYTSLKIDVKIAQSYMYIGNIYADYNDYPKALIYYFKAVKINEQIKNYDNLVSNYGNIATVYNGLGDDKKTIQYGNLSIKYAKLIHWEPALISNYIMFGQLYIKQNNLKQAQQYIAEAYRLAVKNSDDNNIAVGLIGLGIIQQKKENYIEAITKLSESLQRFSSIGNSMGMATAHSELGLSYFLLYKTDKKKEYLAKSKYNLIQSNQLYIENELIDGLPENYLHLSKINEIEKNYKESLINFRLHTQFKDSIFNADKKETIKNLEDKREIEFRDKQLKINKLQIENKERQKWFLVAGLGFAIIIGGLLLYQSRKRKQSNLKLQLLNQNLDAKNLELDEANKAKTRFFSILNHDLRGPVANLVFFLQLQKESPEMLDEESIQRMQDKTMSGAENLLASMEDILQWSKSQMENFKPQPQQFQITTLFEDTKKHFSSVENIQFQFENPSNLALVTDENYLKTIVRNLTGNAIKALVDVQHPMIIWEAFQENGNTYLSITDNGKGATDEEFKALYDEKEVSGIKSGLGLHLIRDLAKAIDCKIKVDSKINEGTTITLKL